MSWSPLVGPPRQDSEALRQTGHELLRSTFWQSLKAGIGSDFTAPGSTASLVRLTEMQDALGHLSSARSDRNLIDEKPPQRTPVTEEEWKKGPDYRPGLSYFQGLTAEAGKLLAERRDAQAARDDTMARYHGGVAATGVQYAARFAAMLADPINIASAFVPVVGEMQAARLAAQLGRYGGRAVTGLVEGAVGQAMIEPLAHVAARSDQEDYTMLDSLLNVSIGAAGGAALHSIAGAIGDAWRSYRGPDLRTRTAAADVAIKQAVSGKPIDVVPVLRAGDMEAKAVHQAGQDSIALKAAADRLDPVPSEPAANAEVPPSKEEIKAAIQDGAAEMVARDAAKERARLERDANIPQTFRGMRDRALSSLIDAFPSRKIDLPSGKSITRKGPMDLVTYLRAIGGVKDESGELKSFDAEKFNKGRDVPFAKGENFMGRLVHDKGLSLEEAARRAADAGYIGGKEVDGRWVETRADPEELKAAIQQTLEAGSIEGRVWGNEDSQPILDYANTMREIDHAEFYHTPEPEHFEPLLDEDIGLDEGYSGADLAGEIDDPEMLWREELERAAAEEANGAEGEPVERSAKPGGGESVQASVGAKIDSYLAKEGTKLSPKEFVAKAIGQDRQYALVIDHAGNLHELNYKSRSDGKGAHHQMGDAVGRDGWAKVTTWGVESVAIQSKNPFTDAQSKTIARIRRESEKNGASFEKLNSFFVHSDNEAPPPGVDFSAPAKAAKAAEAKPLTPEQEIAKLSKDIEEGSKAAAACIARGLG